MSTKLMLRVSFLYELLNSFLVYLFPAKLVVSLFLLPYYWLLRRPSHGEKSLVLSEEKKMSSSAVTSAIDITELKRMFQMFDHNGDGRITKKELSDSFESLGMAISEGELAGMVEKIDVNGDGCVDIEEFGTLYQMIMEEERVEDEDEEILEAFNVFDRNGDGFISVEELRLVLASLGLKQGTAVEDCKRMIMQTDEDGDGMVNFKEFKQMMRGGGFAAAS